jgi:predicted dehydrogenase
MNKPANVPSPAAPVTRRTFLQNGAVLVAGIATLSPAARAQTNKNSKLQVYHVGVGGSIAPTDRKSLKAHPQVAFTGLCDVDSNALDKVSKEHPEAFTCRDFRDGFEKHADQFDAVLVCTPDHNHAVVDLHALKANKHVYGQKPLVQQLAEVDAIEKALPQRPNLITQVGNQRMGDPGRQMALDILKRGALGKTLEAHVWVGGPPEGTKGYFWYGGLQEPTPPPPNIDWPLWLGAAVDAPHRPGLISLQWRSSWDYGTGQLGDWCTHLLDLLYFAYDLPSPIAVQTDTHPASDFYHRRFVKATLTYQVSGDRFAKNRFILHYADQSQAPSRASLGLPAGKWPGSATLVVCEGGILFAEPSGYPQVWIDGKQVDPRTLPGQATFAERNHWHSWVDKILGKPDAFVQTPFAYGARIAEAGLLCSKAARFPGQELRWDKATLSFTNHEEATKTIVRRAEYRKGFELPTMG